MKENTRQRMQALGLRVLNGGDSSRSCPQGQSPVQYVAITYQGGDITLRIGMSQEWRMHNASGPINVSINDRQFTGWAVDGEGLVLKIDARFLNRRARRRVEEIFAEYSHTEAGYDEHGCERRMTVTLNGQSVAVPLWGSRRFERLLYVVSSA